MKISFYLLDTFTSTIFKGSPTSVCWLNEVIEDKMMLSIAQELNFPVTSFILFKKNHIYNIRYFTVTDEIPACGHATLAASEVVFRNSKVNANISFETIENITITCDKKEGITYMEYPKYEMINYNLSTQTLDALTLKKFKSVGFCKELDTLFIEINDAKSLRAINPNYQLLKASNSNIKEVVITSISDDKKYDFLLRSFCPWIGINEDPVTGSVHSVLAEFWKIKLNKDKLFAFQASKRGGEIYVWPTDTVVKLGGKSVLVLKGDLRI